MFLFYLVSFFKICFGTFDTLALSGIIVPIVPFVLYHFFLCPLPRMLSDINFLISYFLHGDIDVLGDIANIAIIASPFFQPSFSPSNGKVGNANRSKSDSNSRSWTTRYFSNSVSAYSFATSWLTLPACVINGRSSLFK